MSPLRRLDFPAPNGTFRQISQQLDPMKPALLHSKSTAIFTAAIFGLLPVACDQKKPEQPAEPKTSEVSDSPTDSSGSNAAPAEGAIAVPDITKLTPDNTGEAQRSETPPPAETAATNPRAILGLANRVPLSAEGFVGFYNLADIHATIEKTAFYDRFNALIDQLDVEEDSEFSQEDFDRFKATFGKLTGQEVGIVFGEGSGAAIAKLLQFSHLNDKISYKTLGAFSGLEADPDPADMLSNYATEADAMVELLNGFTLPNLTLIFNVDDAPALAAEMQADVHAQEEEAMKKLEAEGKEANPAAPEVVTFEGPGGHTFLGATLDGKTAFAKRDTDDDDEDGAQSILSEDDQDNIERLRATAAENIHIEFAFGAIDADHIVLTIGKNRDGLTQFVTDPAKSITSADNMGFVDSYLEKDVAFLSWFTEPLLSGIRPRNPLSAALEAVVESLAITEGMEELATELTPKVAELIARGDAMQELTVTPHVGIAFLEEGIQYEAKGGLTPANQDFSATSKFSLPVGPNVMVAMTSVDQPGRSDMRWDFFEDVFATLYGGTKSFMLTKQQQGEGGPAAMVMGMEGIVSPQITSIYQSLKDIFVEGLGGDSMFVLDFNGAVPEMPGFSERVVQEGRFPRMAFAHSVADREILSDGWDKIVPSVNQLMAFIPSPTGDRMTVPNFDVDETDESTTYSLVMPFETPDMHPALTVSEDVMIMGTTQEFSPKTVSNLGKNTESGSHIYFSFDAVSDAATIWFQLVRDGELEEAGAPPVEDKEAAEMALAQEIFELMGALGTVNERIFTEDDDLRFSMKWIFKDVVTFQ